MANEVTAIKEAIQKNKTLLDIVRQKMDVGAFIEAALQIAQQPGVAACTHDSIMGCLVKAAIFGFRLSQELGQCWIVPRNVNVGTREKATWIKVATFQVGYKGWQELAFRSGKVESFDFGIVRQNDKFDFEQGSAPVIRHKYDGGEYERGDRKGVWASATLMSGRVVFHYCDISEIERHRLMSDTQRNSQTPVAVWGNHYDIMAMRVPMRYLCTLKLPKSAELQAAIESDGAVLNASGDVEAGAVKLLQDEQAAQANSTGTGSGELHPDLVMEVEAAKSVEALSEIWFRQSPNLSGSLKTQYAKLVSKMKEKLNNND